MSRQMSDVRAPENRDKRTENKDKENKDKDNKNIRIRFYFNNILDYGKSKIEQWH